MVAGIVVVIAVGALVDPLWAALAAAPAAVLVGVRHRAASWLHRVLEITGLAAFVATVVSAAAVVRSDRPVPDAGWTDAVDHLSSVALFAVIAIAVGAAFGADASLESRTTEPDPEPERAP